MCVDKRDRIIQERDIPTTKQVLGPRCFGYGISQNSGHPQVY